MMTRSKTTGAIVAWMIMGATTAASLGVHAHADSRASSGAETLALSGIQNELNRVVVRLRKGVAIERLLNPGNTGDDAAWRANATASGVSRIRMAIDPPAKNQALAQELGLDRFVNLDLPDGVSASELASQLSGLTELFDLVEVDAVGTTMVATRDDPLFSSQWHLQNTGQVVANVMGLPGADIRATQAWSRALSLQTVRVAVLDTGVTSNHPDLFGVVVPGRNILSGNDDTSDSLSESHGTYCAGVIAAMGNNSMGVSGVAPNVKIMPVKIISGLAGSSSTCGNAIVWSSDNGARVASMSVGWGGASTVMRSAVTYAGTSGMIMVASAGNTPTAPIGFPAALPGVICVGATDNRDQAWIAQSTGNPMALVAPGVGIWTTVNETSNPMGYGARDGTSMSCPMVAGVVALMLGIRPQLTPAEVLNILQSTASDKGAPGWDPIYGAGRLNAERAVQQVISMTYCPSDFDQSGGNDPGDIFAFLQAYFADDPRADMDGNGAIGPDDLFRFLSLWFAGC